MNLYLHSVSAPSGTGRSSCRWAVNTCAIGRPSVTRWIETSI